MKYLDTPKEERATKEFLLRKPELLKWNAKIVQRIERLEIGDTDGICLEAVSFWSQLPSAIKSEGVMWVPCGRKPAHTQEYCSNHGGLSVAEVLGTTRWEMARIKYYTKVRRLYIRLLREIEAYNNMYGAYEKFNPDRTPTKAPRDKYHT